MPNNSSVVQIVSELNRGQTGIAIIINYKGSLVTTSPIFFVNRSNAF